MQPSHDCGQNQQMLVNQHEDGGELIQGASELHDLSHNKNVG